MSTTAATVTIRDVADALARTARIAVDFGEEVETAITVVATNYTKEADDAVARRGWFSHALTGEQIDQYRFFGAVARDVLDGTVSRPSTGNVRDYVRAQIAKADQ